MEGKEKAERTREGGVDSGRSCGRWETVGSGGETAASAGLISSSAKAAKLRASTRADGSRGVTSGMPRAEGISHRAGLGGGKAKPISEYSIIGEQLLALGGVDC